MDLKKIIRTIPDFPKKGIMFRDITTLLLSGDAFSYAIDQLAERYKNQPIDLIAGIESRGFIFGAALAHQLKMGFVPIRKKGKLPGDVLRESYNLEYGTDSIEIHVGSINRGQRVLLIDDLIATGGTIIAAHNLVKKTGGEVHEACFLVDLPEVGGAKRLQDLGIPYFALLEFEGE
jgi:adenine phosphoribosyltransferase